MPAQTKILIVTVLATCGVARAQHEPKLYQTARPRTSQAHYYPTYQAGQLVSPTNLDSTAVKYVTAMQSHSNGDGAASNAAEELPPSQTSSLLESVTDDPMSAPASDESTANMATDFGDSECCRYPRIWASAEYVHWWTDGTTIPALATTSAQNTPQNQAGRLGLPHTSILFGDEDLSGGSHSGTRLSLGGWIRPWDSIGFDLTILILGNDETQFATGDEFQVLGRPFFNVVSGEQDAKLINFPNLVSGRLEANVTSKFYTGEALLRKAFERSGSSEADWYLGYRTAGLDDHLRISESTVVLSGPIANAQFTLTDQFRTRNTFHGVNFGVRYSEWIRQCLSIELMGKFALGTTRTRTDIVGATVATVAGGSSTSAAGLLGQTSNVGSFINDEFSTISEFDVLMRRQFRPGLSLVLGYTFFFWNDVHRAGDQVDLFINTSQIPPGILSGEARPQAKEVESSFWAHGFRVGLEYIF